MVWAGLLPALVVLLVGRTQAQGPDGCRDCTVGDCLAVPKAEGGCDACICNGLLMPDCAATNCSAGCTLQPTPDGCPACVCPEAAPDVCPPIPACPSRCQIQLGNGCPRCTCPEEAANKCPAVTCPPTCTQVTGADGCPACECPPEDKVCPEMPACPLGCIDQMSDPLNVGCLACNCTIIEELLAENQLIPTGPETPPNQLIPTGPETTPNQLIPTGPETTPNQLIPTGPETTPNQLIPTGPETTPNQLMTTDPETPPENNFAVELVTDSIDPGLVEATEPFTPNQTPNAEIFPTPGSPTVTDPEVVPADPTTPQDLSVTNPIAPQTPALRNPFLNSNGGGNTVGPNIPVAPRIGPNSGLPPARASNQVRPRINIPCGEKSCPPGCSLCIQNNGCGRCLCGDSARVCPAVPPCQIACITRGRGGCFTCACPAPAISTQEFNPLLGPSPFGPGIAFGSDEVFLPSPGGGLPPFVQFVRGPPRGAPPGFVRRGQPGQRRTSPGRVAVQNIPPNLLGQSRFQFFN